MNTAYKYRFMTSKGGYRILLDIENYNKIIDNGIIILDKKIKNQSMAFVVKGANITKETTLASYLFTMNKARCINSGRKRPIRRINTKLVNTANNTWYFDYRMSNFKDVKYNKNIVFPINVGDDQLMPDRSTMYDTNSSDSDLILWLSEIINSISIDRNINIDLLLLEIKDSTLLIKNKSEFYEMLRHLKLPEETILTLVNNL